MRSSALSRSISAISSAWVAEWGRSWLTENEAAFVAGEALVAHVDLRSGIVADQDDGQPGPAQASRDHAVASLRAPRA